MRKHTLTKILTINMILWGILTGCGGGSSNEKSQPVPAPTPSVPTATAKCGQYSIDSDQSCITIGNRSAITYASNDTSEYSGLAIFLHGAPGAPTKVSEIFGSKAIADKFNLVSIAPKGNNSSYEWTSTNNTLSETPDVDYLINVIDEAQSKYTFTDNKIFIFGYSAGGFMAYKLACKIPERLSAVISLAGQFRGDFDACSTSTSIAVHHLHSTIDKEVPFFGRDNGNIASVPDTIAFWQNKNGCSTVIEETIQAGVTAASTETRTEKYTDCVNSVALSYLDSVAHESNYIAESLLSTYEYLLID